MADDTAGFYESLPILTDFAEAVQAENYRPLPDEWILGFADIAGSTRAIDEGRYKAVNFVAAGVVAAVSNALGRKSYPFVFGGDGASFAVAPADAPAAADALARMAAYSKSEFGLELRVATAPVAAARAAGLDVRIARFAASKPCVYAMFTGGGAAWLEEQAKAGHFVLPPAAPGALPDLEGLSCRWGVAPARHGLVVSLIVAPRGPDPRYLALVEEVVALASDAQDAGRPVTLDRLRAGDPAVSIPLEASALKASGVSGLSARLKAAAGLALGVVFHKFRLKAGAFDAALYAADVAANADFRKFDDALRMTLDCTKGFADALEARLAAADDYADWGLHRQTSAQITCFVPTILDRGHVHFVDGAQGGYTMAASALKARRRRRAG
ncbi:MAG: DUF3095 family protein [Beijerinckiaceae bacterium]